MRRAAPAWMAPPSELQPSSCICRVRLPPGLTGLQRRAAHAAGPCMPRCLQAAQAVGRRPAPPPILLPRPALHNPLRPPSCAADAELGGETAFPAAKWLDKGRQAAGQPFSACGQQGVAALARKGNAVLVRRRRAARGAARVPCRSAARALRPAPMPAGAPAHQQTWCTLCARAPPSGRSFGTPSWAPSSRTSGRCTPAAPCSAAPNGARRGRPRGAACACAAPSAACAPPPARS